jgi:LuxR family transcriptional regulator, maltose regulon positive regulatory protein
VRSYTAETGGLAGAVTMIRQEVVTRERPAGIPGASSIIRRKRLVLRLMSDAERPVVLIDAPAGFGKSTVLREWDQADPRPFASLTLGDHHDDPVLLTASIAGAIGDLAPVSEDVYRALHGSKPGTLKVAVPRLLEALAHSRSPIVLALDDAHALNDPDSLSVVRAIADGLPSGSQLALASRSEPAIHLGRLRANRDLLELDATDLAMTHAETSAMLRACGLRLDTESIDVLVDRTEGWPAALYLATLSLSAASDPDAQARRFAGDDRLVVDYLRDEFIANLDDASASFLSRTAILGELTGELCDAVLEREGSAAMLRALARSNALVRALDSKDQAFRYHALLREMLASELHRLHPSEEAELHARAASWHAGRDDYDRAVPHAIATGDVEAAGAMIWSQAARYSSMGREATLVRWLDRFTPAETQSSGPLCLVHATCSLTAGNGSEVAHWTARAVAAVADRPNQEAAAIRVAAGAIEASGAAREGVVSMRTQVSRAFERLPVEDPWRSLCRLIEGASYQLTEEPGLARVALEDGARRGAVGAPAVQTISLAQLALLALDEGDLEAGTRLIHESIARSELNGLADVPTQAIVAAVAAYVLARSGDAAAASRHVKQARALLDELVEMSPWYQAETRIVIARALALLDDVAGARAQLADAARDLRQTPDAPRLRAWLQEAWKEADSATTNGRWPLSPAELRLLHFLPTHLSFREIADELFVSPNTVKTQARSIYQKLGVSSRAEAVSTARTAGLVGTSDAPAV